MEFLSANVSFGSKIKSMFTGKDYYKTESGVVISCEKGMGYVQVDEQGKIIASGLENAKIKGSKNNDDIHVINSNIKEIEGKNGNDKITVENSNLDKIYGNKGRDLVHVVNSNVKKIYGGKGDDTVLAQDSNIELIDGEKGEDTILTCGGYTHKIKQGIFFKDDIWISNNPMNPNPSMYYQIGSYEKSMPEVFKHILA